MLTFGSLFAGIGGMDLGLERSGMRCVWQVEIDPYARRVLEKHWPDVRRHDDVRTFPPRDGADWRCDLICGGFPCQDISRAGNRKKRTGLDGERSGLWSEFARVVRQLRPCFVLVENVPDVLHRGLGRILGDMAENGYDAEWDCLPAAYFGSPQRRDRFFLVAHTRGLRAQRIFEGEVSRVREFSWCQDVRGPADLLRRSGLSQPLFRRTGNGVPAAVDRLRCLGNAVVPQVAEWIGRRILSSLSTSRPERRADQ